ncbi:hypothetical protein BDN72DRAFT_882896 [Pluteus cervinus]|uniref:Uncharacterized protein n=1 Tax=Pluteus cervinus TaxID=181527 RepID=A0ACD3A971_9AGAR|nr:hypothetical protein BDN72DRAFT_882896 [Pluteus cervinus]
MLGAIQHRARKDQKPIAHTYKPILPSNEHHISLMLHACSAQIPEPSEITIQKLDSEIQYLAEQLYLLKAQRNGFTLTYALPDEILSEIFAIAQVYCKVKTRSRSQSQSFSVLREWLPITHVSQHWRMVALECSQLWCEIINLPEPAIPVFLGRSRERNLSVEIAIKILPGHVPSTHPPALLAEIFAQNSRIRRLVVIGDSTFTQVLPYITATPAPKLKELFINAYGARIPDDLYQGTTPQLETLSLDASQFNPNNPIFMNDLTNLEIPNYTESTRAWLEVLQRTTRLSRLKMRSSPREHFGGSPFPVPKDIGVVTLPQLSVFDFRSYSLERDLDFLSHLTFPSQTQFKFQSATHLEDQGITPPLLAFLRVHHRSRRDISEMTVNSVVYGLSRLSLYLTTSADQCPLTVDISLSESELRTTNAGNATHLAEITSLPLSTTTSFTTNCNIKLESWKILSDRLPNLQAVIISKPTIALFLLSIVDFDFNSDGDGFAQFLLSIGTFDSDFDSDGDADRSDEEEGGEENEETNGPEINDEGILTSSLDLKHDSSENQDRFKALKSVHLDRISLEGLHKAIIHAMCPP